MEHKLKTREKKSLKRKWADIKHEVQNFIELYQKANSRQVFETNAEDTFQLAKKMYRENYLQNKSFNFD